MAQARTQPPKGDTYRPSADVASRQLDEQTVLVNLHTNRIFELNRTGARLWELLDEAPTESQLVTRLLAEFEVSEDELTGEVRSLIDSLLAADLITRESQHA